MSPIARKSLVGAIIGVLGSSVVGIEASAADITAHGATVAGVTMYAGPSEKYPQVMHLAGGLQISIHGCATDGQWCDVTWRGKRGWVAAPALAYLDKGESMPVAAAKAIPTATFEFSRYWDANYRSRLWYSDRAKWQGLDARGAQSADAGQLPGAR